jgi:hypothetical protein
MFAQGAKYIQAHMDSCCFRYHRLKYDEKKHILIKLRATVVSQLAILKSILAQGRKLSLFNIIGLTLRRKATDPRDKVYRLLGLVTN